MAIQLGGCSDGRGDEEEGGGAGSGGDCVQPLPTHRGEEEQAGCTAGGEIQA